MAKSKSQKEAMLAEYMDWLAKSKAVVLVEYAGLKMKDLDAIRAKARENGGEFHIVKNTLAKLALEKAGYSVPADFAEKSTAIGFAFTDSAGFTKALNPAQVKSLASLPPLPVLRAQLLGVLQAPASKLVRTLAEPGRSLASVVKAYSDKAAPTAA